MANALRDFQVFVKPAGSLCNLECRYCYYVGKERLCGSGESRRMADDTLEVYIRQHIEASSFPTIRFSWHGGEPTVLGVGYFRRIVELQRKHQPRGRHITNGIQTNGTLLDEEWCRFFASEGFTVGISLDGPPDLHDCYRIGKGQAPSHERVMRGYELLRRYGIPCEVLCVVHDRNVCHPLEVYRFFRQIGVANLGFLPLVEALGEGSAVSERSVPASAFGDFLCVVFDEWLGSDVGRINVQIFEEAIATAIGRQHGVCIFRETCGEIPAVGYNGDFFSCDHFVDSRHRIGNIRETPLVELLDSPSQRAFGEDKRESLPRICRTCEVLAMCNGGCPKDRFISTPDGEGGLSYLCAGYRRFFTHSRPFAEEVARLWRVQTPESASASIGNDSTRKTVRTGRNDPCPCGSGRKYKKCCMGKQ